MDFAPILRVAAEVEPSIPRVAYQYIGNSHSDSNKTEIYVPYNTLPLLDGNILDQQKYHKIAQALKPLIDPECVDRFKHSYEATKMLWACSY
ncbi:hypothetical protein LguiB_011162 [Lonicera macranthoides]